jgi:hypothetical protein
MLVFVLRRRRYRKSRKIMRLRMSRRRRSMRRSRRGGTRYD